LRLPAHGGAAGHPLGVRDLGQPLLALGQQILVPLRQQAGDLADAGADEFLHVGMHHPGRLQAGQALLQGLQRGAGGRPGLFAGQRNRPPVGSSSGRRPSVSRASPRRAETNARAMWRAARLASAQRATTLTAPAGAANGA